MSIYYPPSSIFMLNPKAFAHNNLTADSNSFQSNLFLPNLIEVEQEFSQMVQLIRDSGIEVLVIEDTPEPAKPDAIFINNWISTHEDGSVFIYPMKAINRRIERRADIVETLYKNFIFSGFIDLSATEKEGQFLEGTGSLVIDHIERWVYACISSRTNESLAKAWADKMDYGFTSFHAFNEKGKAIYHTNVMLSIGEDYAVICSESILNLLERKTVLKQLRASNKTIIEISFTQMNHFAGNILQLANKENKNYIVISTTAYSSLTTMQIDQLTKNSELIIVNVNTIEQVGGGSCRCMIAENYLQKRN